MKRIKNMALWLVVIIYFVIVSGSIAERRNHLNCNGMEINIADSTHTGFFNREDIAFLVQGRQTLIGKPVKEIYLKEIEERLMKQRQIEKAETYITEDGILHILISHRKPVLRIEDRQNNQYYLDASGNIFPASGRFTPHLLFANGNIRLPSDVLKSKNIYNQEADQTGGKNKVLHQLLELVNYINANEFWRAQIVQIYVNEQLEFELIPRIGAHFILLGPVENYTEKLDNLKTLYLEYFNKKGWNEYTVINLKYKDQIICTKR